MAFKSVEGVVFWRYKSTAFKAAYGRLGDVGGYTKQYLQVPQGPRDLLDSLLHRQPGERVEVKWCWPDGGELLADWKGKQSDPRGELDIRVKSETVKPFKVGDTDEPGIAIPGDPDKKTVAEADAELQSLLAKDLAPWIFAIKLKGEERVLHARAYLANAPVALSHYSTRQLPESLQSAIAKLSESDGCGSWRPTQPTPRAPEILSRIKAALQRDPNVLLVGPPGAGKTVALEDLRAEYEHQVAFDPEVWTQNWTSSDTANSERRAVNLVFHPSYAYENFVAGLVPSIGDNGSAKLEARPGPLLALAHWSKNAGREALLIIDEFNRGPAAAIFGDTLALLDGGKRESALSPGASIDRPFPQEEMVVPAGFAQAGGERRLSKTVTLPDRLKIVAAMNSTDRSVAPLDAALRRRFAIVRVDPDPSVLAQHLGIDLAQPAEDGVMGWSPQRVRRLAVELLVSLNERIEHVLGPDHTLGHALLWGVGDVQDNDVAEALAAAFEEKILATLRLTFTDQDEALAAVLGGESEVVQWRDPPASVASVSPRRLHFRRLNELSPDERMNAIEKIVRA